MKTTKPAPKAQSKSQSRTKSRTANKHRPITRLADLTPGQLDQLAAWHTSGLSIQDCAARATAEFQRSIPKTSVQRFLEHRRAAELLGDAPAALEAASEINQYAATGRAEFSDASLFLLEKQAFDLIRRRAPGDDLAELKDLFLLIHKARNTAVRERHAAVQETKAKLRQREFDWKKKQADEIKEKTFGPGEQEEAVFRIFGELPEPKRPSPEALAAEFNPDGSFKRDPESTNEDINDYPLTTPSSSSASSAPSAVTSSSPLAPNHLSLATPSAPSPGLSPELDCARTPAGANSDGMQEW